MSSPQLFFVQEDEKEMEIRSLIIEEAFQRCSDNGPDLEIAPSEEPPEFRDDEDQEDDDEDGDDEININIVCEKQDLEWFSTAEDTSLSISPSTKSQNLVLGHEYDKVGDDRELDDDDDDDDNDDFATPVSSPHKIPVTAQCPPAPKKIIRTPAHTSSRTAKRRKSPVSRTRRPLHLDLSREVELMFPPTVRVDLGRKIKKARIED